MWNVKIVGENNACVDGIYWHSSRAVGDRVSDLTRSLRGQTSALEDNPAGLLFGANDEPREGMRTELGVTHRSKYLFVSFC